ncbi:ankyrin-3-like [Photinus pyralis]|uniref:ankyrin-3-like n=1 Tax=Photinus pyralis TaxID=7054 RepID=UPI001266EA8D|nr:ankyrin-3-like [Photinus pyralis]
MKVPLLFICLPSLQIHVNLLSELDNGEYFDRKSPNIGDTALHESVRRGYIVVTQRLLDIGADANLENDFGNTPVHVAVSSNQVPGLRMLIRYGADINVENKDQYTPLMVALRVDNREIAQILLENNATIHSKECNTLLDLATTNDDVDLLNSTFARCEPTKATMDSLLETAGFVAANTVFEYLLNKGADYTIKTRNGNTLLYLAVQSGNPDAAELILDAALSSARHSKGETDPTGGSR